MPIKAVAVLNGEVAKGVVTFEQADENSAVRVHGEVKGLAKGLHGFHVHQYGDTTNGCTSAGAHFNPFNKTHGGPEAAERHVGDLGNVTAGDDGVAKFDFTDAQIKLNGPNSILGRAMVIHADQDDLGLGGVELSKTTGNAGARLACGVIGITNV